MWYVPRHKQSFWKKHANSLILIAGMMITFVLPVFALFTIGN